MPNCAHINSIAAPRDKVKSMALCRPKAKAVKNAITVKAFNWAEADLFNMVLIKVTNNPNHNNTKKVKPKTPVSTSTCSGWLCTSVV